MVKRWAWLIILLAVIALTASLAFVAGRVTSPQQRAAQALPPKVTAATARVTMRRLSPRIVGRGAVAFGGARTVRLPASEKDTVTYARLRTGISVRVGDLLLEVAGQPVLAFESPFSPYRDLRAGDSGRDVSMLKKAVRGLGYRLSAGSQLDAGDIEALVRLYRIRGYSLPTEAALDGGSLAEGSFTDPTASSDTTATPRPGPTPAAPNQAAQRRVAYLPASWWVGVPELPATVASAGPGVGQSLSADGERHPLRLSTSSVRLTVTVPQALADEIAPDATVSYARQGAPVMRWIVAAATTSAGAQETPEGTRRVVVDTTTSIPQRLAGSDAKVVIEDPTAQPQLAVPVSALQAGSAGSASLRVHRGGATTVVAVQTGAQLDGWIGVSVAASALRAGDLVELG